MGESLIAVFGSSSGGEEDRGRAYALGRGLGEAGYGVLNGGYGGTMAETARGVRAVGGTAVGVTCSEFTFRAGPNPHLSEVVEAPSLFARLETLVRRASGYVVLPGGNGTLAELALTWEYQRRELLPARPTVVWERPWRPLIEALAETPYVTGGMERLVWVDSVEAAVAAIRSAAPPQEPASESGTSRDG